MTRYKDRVGDDIRLTNLLAGTPGVKGLRKRIVDEREKRPFLTKEDLRRVPGVGPKTLDKLRPYITTGTEAAAAAKE